MQLQMCISEAFSARAETHRSSQFSPLSNKLKSSSAKVKSADLHFILAAAIMYFI